MRYGSVCSGIEAASVAWHPLGWQASFYSEIDAFPRAVLAHRFPQTPLHGDFTTIEAGHYEPIDLLVGGTPCQSFSIAGLRGGLDDDRGNLALEYLRLADRLRPRWLVWENVPGVLSSNGRRDFGSILGGMVQLGYGIAYRVLDAQYFGVPQRRRRVFVVGYSGDWRRAAAVLFERHSLQGHHPPRRKAGQGVAVSPTLRAGGNRTGGDRPPGTDVDTADSLIISEAFGGGNTRGALDVAACLVAKGQKCDFEVETFIAHSLRAEGFDASEDGTGRGAPLVPVVYGKGVHTTGHQGDRVVGCGDVFPALSANGENNGGGAGALAHVGTASAVRRLTPVECERLQGFPDGWTDIPWRGRPHAPDGPRYKALGNSMAVPCMAWIGERITLVEAITRSEAA